MQSESSLYRSLKVLAEAYHKTLIDQKTAGAKRAMRYLTKTRGLTLKTIKEFAVGYCENGNGYKALKKANLLDMVESTGMFHPQKVETTPVELFDGMVTFPVIIDTYECRTVAHFSGRYIDDDWVTNNMLSPHKHRRGQFYHVFNQEILYAQHRYVVIVESPIDAMTLSQAGYYAIATFGVNGVNEEIAKLLKQHTVYICYDNDLNKSGIRGARRLAQMLSEFNITSYIITLPLMNNDKMDVNEYFKLITYADEDFERLMDNAWKFTPEEKRKKDYVKFNTLDITKVMNRYIKTKRRVHRGYLCVCPFHKESKPSMHIFTDKNEYFCYGCGKAGDTLQLLMRIEELHGNKLSIKDAIAMYETL